MRALCFLLTFTTLLAGEQPQAFKAPQFSWDTVPRAISAHKPTPWTDDEYTRIARVGMQQTSVNDKALEMVREVKKFSPEHTVLGYKNLVLHIETTQDSLFRDHPTWFLFTNGKPELNGAGRYKRPMYDLRKPEVREYWVKDVERILNIPELDGIFFDALAKVMNYEPVKRATGQDPPVEFIAGYHQMMDEHLRRCGSSTKIRIGNYLRADRENYAIPEVMKYLDGSYLEWFDHYMQPPPGQHPYEDYLAAGIEAVQKVAQTGRVITLHLSPQDDHDIKATIDGADPQFAASSQNMYKNFEYKLAIFLIAAERYSYFQYQASPKVIDDMQAWAPDFPEFHKPLGAPKGPARRKGYTYTREFQHAKVWLDLSKRQGRITWDGSSYPEVKSLTPSHHEGQVKPGALECRMDFNREIRKGKGAISLYRMKDRRKLTTVGVENVRVEGTTAVIRLQLPLEPHTEYSVTLEKGAFQDARNMSFQGLPVLGEWKFTTR